MSSPSFIPVLAREMRAAAHRWPLFVQRMAAAMMALVIIGVYWIDAGNSLNSAELSKDVFTRLHIVILAAIWILVPSMLADTLSRERREGTLDLLFLTPLSTSGIVIGKAAAGALRAISLCLAVLPMMALPLLMGGITPTDIVTAMVIELSCLILAIGAGLLASSKTRSWGIAVGSSYLYSAILLYAFSLVVAGWPVFMLLGVQLRGFYELESTQLLLPLGFIFLPEAVSNTICSRNVVIKQSWIAGITAALPVSLLCLSSILRRTGAILQRERKHQISRPEKWLSRINDRLTAWIRPRGIKRTFLDLNPIFWLRLSSPWSVMLPKIWLGAFLVFHSVLYWVDYRYDHSVLNSEGHLILNCWAGAVLLVLVALVNTSSFQNEKENGVLQLLLVAPLTVNELIWGGACASWYQFRYSLVILAVSTAGIFVFETWIYGNSIPQTASYLQFAIVFLTTYFTLPFASFYAGLRLKQAWRSCILAILLGILVPYALGMELGGFIPLVWTSDDWTGLSIIAQSITVVCLILSQIAAAALARFLLQHSLSRRLFPV